jgi:hypothetical protein
LPRLLSIGVALAGQKTDPSLSYPGKSISVAAAQSEMINTSRRRIFD